MNRVRIRRFFVRCRHSESFSGHARQPWGEILQRPIRQIRFRVSIGKERQGRITGFKISQIRCARSRRDCRKAGGVRAVIGGRLNDPGLRQFGQARQGHRTAQREERRLGGFACRRNRDKAIAGGVRRADFRHHDRGVILIARQRRFGLVILKPGDEALEIILGRRRAMFFAEFAVFSQGALEQPAVLAGHEIEGDFRHSLAGRGRGEKRGAGEDVGKHQGADKRQGTARKHTPRAHQKDRRRNFTND